MSSSSVIPQKSSFKFQELTPITGVKPYVIRFWETEFHEINPVESDSGQKIYSRQDVEFILKIKELLFEQKLSIPEAKKALLIKEEEEEVVQHLVSSKPDTDLTEVSALLRIALSEIKEIKEKRNW
ncbi:MAG: MerR family transcriptional regulator [Bacteriovoracaceae bacterium]